MIETESLREWIRDDLNGSVPVVPEEVAVRTLGVFKEIRTLKENGYNMHDLITHLQSRGRSREAELLDEIERLEMRDIESGIRGLRLKYDAKKKPEIAV